MKQCECGNRKFHVDQMQRHTVTVDVQNEIIEEHGIQEVYNHSGIYICTVCREKYDGLDELEDPENPKAPINIVEGEYYTDSYLLIPRNDIVVELCGERGSEINSHFIVLTMLNEVIDVEDNASFMYIGELSMFHTSDKSIIGLDEAVDDDSDDILIYKCINNNFPENDQVTLIPVENKDETV